eukprot:s2397_g10.t1
MKRQSADFVDAERPFKQVKSTNSNSDSEYWEREYRKRLASAKDAQTVRDTWQEARNYISLNQIHLTTALKACQNDSGVAMQIMREARLEGLQPNIFHFTCLLRIPGTPTKKILKRMEKDSIEGNHWSWNAALTGCPAEEVWDIFGQVPQPDRYAIASLLKKCNSPLEVLRAFKAARKHRVQFDRAILNAAVSAAPEIFTDCIHQIQLQNPKIQPDLQFFNIVLNKAAELEDSKAASNVAKKAFAELRRRGFRPDTFSVNRMLVALLRAGAFDEAKNNVLDVHQNLLDKHSWTIYGKFLVEANRADEAICIYKGFRKDPSTLAKLKPDVAFFNVYLSACAKGAKLEMAKKIRNDMEQRQIWPDQITHHCMMQTLAAAGQLDAAEEELQTMEENEKTYNYKDLVTARTYNTLIDASTKAADFRRAKRLLNAMQAKNLEADVFTFNILINGAANMGQYKKAERYFTKMQKMGISPDAVTAVTLLNAYSHSGEADKAFDFHEQLASFGLRPSTSSMNALVDCLSRSGNFQRAWEQVQVAESKGLSDTVTYMAFLGSCRNLKSKLHAKAAFNKLKEHADKPALASAYVLMSELYERLGQGDKARGLEAERVSLGLVKQRGESYLHLAGGGSRTFVVGAESPEESRIIDDFNAKIRAGGYRPDLSSASARHDTDEAKERSLSGHSEKKAVAVGLHLVKNTNQNEPISVTKNLRVCNDCHAAMAVASKVFCKEIHLRDRSRWHVFKDGVCSCSDCW